jgi:hypothetical protein
MIHGYNNDYDDDDNNNDDDDDNYDDDDDDGDDYDDDDYDEVVDITDELMNELIVNNVPLVHFLPQQLINSYIYLHINIFSHLLPTSYSV